MNKFQPQFSPEKLQAVTNFRSHIEPFFLTNITDAPWTLYTQVRWPFSHTWNADKPINAYHLWQKTGNWGCGCNNSTKVLKCQWDEEITHFGVTAVNTGINLFLLYTDLKKHLLDLIWFGENLWFWGKQIRDLCSEVMARRVSVSTGGFVWWCWGI